MDEVFRPTTHEFLALARYWAETRSSFLLGQLDDPAADLTSCIDHATERLAEIAAECEEEEVEAVVAQVEDRHRALVGDDRWRALREGTAEQRRALAAEWEGRESEQGGPPEDGGPVEGVLMHYVFDGRGRGWLHTHGMDRRGLPELEVRDVPSYLAEAAARILRAACRYLRQPGVQVKVGETMAVSPKTAFRLVRGEPIPGCEDHYETERWQVVEPETLHCEESGESSVSGS
jgi:hypothetical protein